LQYLCNGTTDFGEIWYNDAYGPSRQREPIKFCDSTIQDGGGDHLENTKNCNISTKEPPIFTKFGEVMRLGYVATVSQ